VLAETVYTLQSFYRMSRADIAAALLPIIALKHLKIPNKARLRKTFAWYVRYNLSFTDACLAATAWQQWLPAIVSFDRNYDRIPGIARLEP
jgi:predicted nucleic-acid-binding protein